ncbi:VOC family protein [Actinoplanes sp. NPDC049596]|uniref:VOC family protein n=1 Tax=unclassified Actinoplanes TaxID=2626549 RepID=UPI00344A627F
MDRVVHFEVPFGDGDRARSFYQEAFGWQLGSIPGLDYTIATTAPTDDNGRPSEPGAINGGMFAREAPFQGPVLVLGVDNIDESLAKIEKSGGKTAIPRQPVGDMGYCAYFHDTEGNLLGLWENA